jgi:beta-D-xylosidase 4
MRLKWLIWHTLVVAVVVFPAHSAFTFPDCTNGPLKATPVCDFTKDPATRARTLIQMFTDDELIRNGDNTSPGVPRLGLPPYEWWSEALVSSLNWPSSLLDTCKFVAWRRTQSWCNIRAFG